MKRLDPDLKLTEEKQGGKITEVLLLLPYVHFVSLALSTSKPELGVEIL